MSPSTSSSALRETPVVTANRESAMTIDVGTPSDIVTLITLTVLRRVSPWRRSYMSSWRTKGGNGRKKGLPALVPNRESLPITKPIVPLRCPGTVVTIRPPTLGQLELREASSLLLLQLSADRLQSPPSMDWIAHTQERAWVMPNRLTNEISQVVHRSISGMIPRKLTEAQRSWAWYLSHSLLTTEIHRYRWSLLGSTMLRQRRQRSGNVAAAWDLSWSGGKAPWGVTRP